MWYIFPQILGLGHCSMTMYYAIQSREETVAYWEDSVLRSRMTEICQVLVSLDDSIDHIMGYPDNLKLCSSMTLFEVAAPEVTEFSQVLDRFYDGIRDAKTLKLLKDN